MLFHLHDSETGRVSPTAAASIRLNTDGRVVEISGLEGGSAQRVEDALIPTVEAKATALPGGNHYLEAFADKDRLIAMDKKFQAGEPFTTEELEFLYEFHRPIKYVETHGHDTRPKQFKQGHLAEYQDILRPKHGKNVDLIDGFNKGAENIKQLLNDGYDPNFISSKLKPNEVAANLTQLREAGAEIDVNQLVDQLRPGEIVDRLTQLLAAGADRNQIRAKGVYVE